MLEYICSGTTRTQPASLGNPKGEEDTNNTQRPPPSHTTQQKDSSPRLAALLPCTTYHTIYHHVCRQVRYQWAASHLQVAPCQAGAANERPASHDGAQ